MPHPRSLHVRVVEVIAETPDAHSLVLEPAPEDEHRFTYKPGQFLTFRIPAAGTGEAGEGGGAARCYSLASSPLCDDRLKVTVKRVRGGYGSHWICDNVVAGSTLEVLRPAGTFSPATLDEDLLLFAGGSGITPVMSILKSALHSGSGHVTLVYANRDESSVIFRAELAALAAEFPERLHVHHWLETLQGLPSTASLRALSRPYTARQAFICGPEPFMDAAGAALGELGVPHERVHTERFSSLTGDPFAAPGAAPVPDAATAQEAAATVEVRLDGRTSTVPWPRGTRLLDTLLDAGLDAPSSCREGACSACAVRVLTGEAAMERNEVLEKEDLEEGYLLACQATPVSDHLTVSYDE